VDLNSSMPWRAGYRCELPCLCFIKHDEYWCRLRRLGHCILYELKMTLLEEALQKTASFGGPISIVLDHQKKLVSIDQVFIVSHLCKQCTLRIATGPNGSVRVSVCFCASFPPGMWCVFVFVCKHTRILASGVSDVHTDSVCNLKSTHPHSYAIRILLYSGLQKREEEYSVFRLRERLASTRAGCIGMQSLRWWRSVAHTQSNES
jgi:hypothetical protein